MTEAEVRTIRRSVERELRRYRDYEDWEDVCQEAMILCWQQWPRLQGRYALATVVRVCARSAFSSWYRSRRARRQWRPPGRRAPPEVQFLEELPEDTPAGDPFCVVMERIAAAQVTPAALAAMTPRQAEMTRASVMADRPFRQVAADLHLAPKTVWTLVMRGLARARAAIGEV